MMSQKNIFIFWIIHKDAGVVIFEQVFGNSPITIESDLIGGFLMAIQSFSKEATGENITSLQLETVQIVYHNSPQYVLACSVDRSVNTSLISKKLENLKERFDEKYSDILNGFSGEISVFEGFAEEVEKEFESKSLTLRFMKESLEILRKHYEEKKVLLEYVMKNYFKQKEKNLLDLDIIKNVKSSLEKLTSFTRDLTREFEQKIRSNLISPLALQVAENSEKKHTKLIEKKSEKENVEESSPETEESKKGSNTSKDA